MAELNDKLREVYTAFATERKETKLSKTAQSKDITLSEWNVAVGYLEALLSDVLRIYKKALPEIDENLLSNPDAVYNAVHSHLENNLSVDFSFDKSTGEFGIILKDGTDELRGGSVTNTGLNKVVTEIAATRDPETGTWRLECTLLDGSVIDTSLEELVNQVVLKSNSDNILYGTDSDGNQLKYYANSYDNDGHIPPKEPWSNIIPTKEFVKARNPTYQHGFTPTVEQYGKKDMKGWYRIAVKTPTKSGEGHAGNLFKVHCYVNGAGDCDIVFLVDQAEWNTKYVAISVLSYSYRTAKVITDIRVAYPKKDYKEDTLAYIDVYVNVNPAATGFDSARTIMFRTEELFYNSTRSWVPIQPRVVRDFVEGSSVDGIRVENGVLVDIENLPNGKKSNDAYPNYGYHVFSEKSAVDHAWSDVTLSTSDINSLPGEIEKVRRENPRWDVQLPTLYQSWEAYNDPILTLEIHLSENECNIFEVLIHLIDADLYSHGAELLTIRANRSASTVYVDVLQSSCKTYSEFDDNTYRAKVHIKPTYMHSYGGFDTECFIKKLLNYIPLSPVNNYRLYWQENPGYDFS